MHIIEMNKYDQIHQIPINDKYFTTNLITTDDYEDNNDTIKRLVMNMKIT